MKPLLLLLLTTFCLVTISKSLRVLAPAYCTSLQCHNVYRVLKDALLHNKENMITLQTTFHSIIEPSPVVTVNYMLNLVYETSQDNTTEETKHFQHQWSKFAIFTIVRLPVLVSMQNTLVLMIFEACSSFNLMVNDVITLKLTVHNSSLPSGYEDNNLDEALKYTTTMV